MKTHLLTSKKKSSVAWKAAIVSLLVACPLFAQVAPTGTVSGVVKDPAGLVVANARVTIVNSASNYTRTEVTKEDGVYDFPALPIGVYNVAVATSGFKTETQQGVTLNIGQEAVVNFALQPGGVQEQVVVQADETRVDTTSSALGHLVDNKQIVELPLNGRNFVDLTLLQTGVTQYQNNQFGTSALFGEFYSANGAPLRSNMYTLDGAIMGNAQGASASSISGESLGLDGIAEYRVMTNSFSAEYGLAMGSQTAIVTKGGTNQFHGDVFEYLRNNVLNARNYFDQLYSLPSSVPGGGRRIAPFERNQFGGSIGGPIKKDKTFFFGTYEGFREVDDDPPNVGQTPTIPAACHTPVVGGVETVTSACDTALTGNATENVNTVIQPILALFPLPNVQPGNQFTYESVERTHEDYAQGRIDHTLSASDTLFGRYTYDNTNETYPKIFPIFDTGLIEKQQYATLGENHVFSPRLLNAGRFSYSRSHVVDNTPSTSNPYTSQLTGPQYSCVTGQPICPLNVTSIANFSDTGARSTLLTQNVFSVGDDVFLTKGKHSLKIGMLFNHFDQYADIDHIQKGMVNFSSLQSFLLGKYRNYTVYAPGYNGLKDELFATVGSYIEDEYRVFPRLTLNLGFRYEFATTPNEKNGRQSYFVNPPYTNTVTLGSLVGDPTYTDYSPRLGFALDVFGDGKTSFKGGAAILYDLANQGAVYGLAGAALPPYSLSYVVTPTTPVATTLGATPVTYPTLVLPLPIPANTGSLRGLSPMAIQHNYKTPHIFDFNLSVEQQLPGHVIFSVAYAGSRGINLWQPPDETNPYCPTTYSTILQGCAGITTQIPGSLPTWLPTTALQTCSDGSRATQCRLNPFFSNFSVYQARGESWYHSLQLNATKSLSHGLQFQVAYTWSKLLDDTEGVANSDTTGATTGLVEDPLDPKLDYGIGDFDVRHNLHINGLYHFPDFTDRHIAGKFVNGWWMGTIASLQTGVPFSVDQSTDREQSGLATSGGGIERVSYVTSANVGALTAAAQAKGYTTCPPGSVGCYTYNPVPYNRGTVYTHSVNQWFNPNMFALQPVGTIGNVGRNTLNEPGLIDWDISVNKDTKLGLLGDAGRIQFRAEFFNVLNHTNLGVVHVGGVFAGTLTDTVERPNFSGINTTSGFSRQIQFSMKALF